MKGSHLRFTWLLCAGLAAALLAGCGRGGGEAAVAAAPARAGDVWELDRAADRDAAPVALAAYVHGLHVLLLDGDDAYAGMTRLRAQRGDGGVRVLALGGGARAELVAGGDAYALRFADGSTIPLRRQDAATRK